MLPTESSRYASAGGLCPVDFFPLIRKNRLGAHKGTISALLPPKNDESFPSVVLDPLHPECPAGLDNVAVIIMATGWSQASFPFFPTELSENLGLPTKTSEMRLYRRILPPPSSWPHRNIAFNGMFNVPVNSVAMEVAAHWIHEVFLGNDTARDPNDAAWNAEIGAAMPLPSDTQILHRIQIFEDWMRTQYIDPARPKRKETKRVHASDTFMNWISYCDDLCKDMGVRTNRKRSAKEDWEGVHTADDWGTLGEERGVARRARGRWGPWFGSLKARL